MVIIKINSETVKTYNYDLECMTKGEFVCYKKKMYVVEAVYHDLDNTSTQGSLTTPDVTYNLIEAAFPTK